MRSKVVMVRGGASAVVVCMLAACSSVESVKDVTMDKEGYLARRFSPTTLHQSVTKKIPSDAGSAGFGRLTITKEASAEHSDGKKESFKSVSTLVDGGNGLVEDMTELSNNDVPYALSYRLTYRGLMRLRWQEVLLQATNTGQLYEVKGIRQFDPLPAAAGQEVEIDFRSGLDVQIANFTPNQLKCKATRALPASEVNQKLTGQAIELECKFSANHSVQERSKWMLLRDYGVAVETESANSVIKATYRIVDVVKG